jgi:hypothetical protein
MALAAVALVLIVGAVLASPGAASNYSCAQLLPSGGSPTDGQTTIDQGRQHVGTGGKLEYLHCPPASGPHYSEGGVAPVRPGFYGPDADVGPGSWVHNLEHGYVVALYRCPDDTCPSDEQVAELRAFVNTGPSTPSAQRCGIPSKVLAARFDDMSTPFALLAWNRVLLLEQFDADAALDFARRWLEVGAPEATSC